MNILFLSQIVPYPPHGGVLQRGYNIIREIGKYNQVHLVAFIHPEYLGTPDLLAEARTELEKHCASVHFFPLWPKQSRLHKLVAFGLGLFYPKPFSALAHSSRSYRNKAREILRTQAIDVLHIDTIGLARYRDLAGDTPCLLTHHNIESTLMARRSKVEGGPLQRFYVGLQAKRLLRYEASESPRFAMNAMMSPNDSDDLQRIAPGVLTTLVPNGVDTQYFQPLQMEQDLAAIYTGGMNMYANKDAVLYFLKDIWPQVLRDHPNARFYAIGQDPPRELQDIASKDTSVIVTGYVDDIRPYVGKAAVYVVPLRVGGGTRLKVLDALAQGKAIVSTSVGCEGIAVTHGKDILIEDDPKRFAAQVSGLFSNVQARATLAKAARELAVSTYDWAAIGQALQRAYEQIRKQ